jgi:hypothetical protein
MADFTGFSEERLALMQNVFTTDLLLESTNATNATTVEGSNDGSFIEDEENVDDPIKKAQRRSAGKARSDNTNSNQSADILGRSSGCFSSGDYRRRYSDDIDYIEAEKLLDPYAPANIGILASYLSVGFVIYFIQAPLIFYMVNELSASPAQQSIVIGLMQLPWGLKIFCGFLSDSLPIGGMRRKPYMIIGWLIFIGCNVGLLLIGTPDIRMLGLAVFCMTMGFILADMCTDAMVLDRSRQFEQYKNKGMLQATGYIVRFFGALMGGVAGALIYNS